MPFYAAKGRLLPCKTHTFRCWICNLQIINTLRTFRESISNGFQCCCEYIYAGTINRSPTAANGLPFRCKRIAIMLRTPTKLVANIPSGVGDRFIAPVSLHNQIRIFTSSNTCFRFTAHAYPHYRIRVFTLLNTHFHITTRTFPFAISWVFSYTRAR